MTIKYSVMNYKGGTGKTTVSVNLAHALALEGKKVLLVDTDSQGSVAHALGLKPRYTLYDLLMGGHPLAACTVQARPNLDVVCSNERIFAAEMALSQHKGRELILSKRLNNVDQYDYVLIDCPPSMNLLNQNSLLFARNILLPVSMQYMSLVGIKQLLNNIKIVNRLFRSDIGVRRVIPTFFSETYDKSKDIIGSLERVFPGRVSTPIRAVDALSEAPGAHQTIFEFDPSSISVQDFKKLMEEVLLDGE